MQHNFYLVWVRKAYLNFPHFHVLILEIHVELKSLFLFVCLSFLIFLQCPYNFYVVVFYMTIELLLGLSNGLHVPRFFALKNLVISEIPCDINIGVKIKSQLYVNHKKNSNRLALKTFQTKYHMCLFSFR